MSEQLDGNEPIRVEVTGIHIDEGNPSSTTNGAMARALRDAGFKDVVVGRSFMRLDGVEYQVDDLLEQWQIEAMDGVGMTPIAMKLNRKGRLLELVEEC